ncbi:MAG: hypothetical protein PHU21_05080 [Elusimicrobia bacterium]|jgi:hypothetical protein|nr:hypothetical protein [Elusimicrobiota bacterium]
MDLDSPSVTRVFIGAAVLVLAVGWAVTQMNLTPTLSAATAISAVSDDGMRDAVASPALPVAASGWFAAAGASALSRAAGVPSTLSPLRRVLPPRPTSGRAVFSGRRVMVEAAKPGVPAR